MNSLIALRESIKAFYGRYTTAVRIVLKFILAFAAFFMIRVNIGYQPIANNMFVILVLALLCSIMPLQATPVFGGCLVIADAFSVSMETGALVAVIFLLILILFLRFVPQDSLILTLLPMTAALGAPQAVPIVFGLKKKPSSMLSAAAGVIVYSVINALRSSQAAFEKMTDAGMTERMTVLMNSIFADKGMVLNLLTLPAVFLMVYAIRKMSFKHSYTVAILTGAALYLLMEVLGHLMLGTSFDVVSAVSGTAVSIIAAFILMFFIFHVNYSASEYLQFEDDDYCYYVKAIPKISVKHSGSSDEGTYSGTRPLPDANPSPRERPQTVSDSDIREKLEDSLKNL